MTVVGTVQCYGFWNFKSDVVEMFRRRYDILTCGEVSGLVTRVGNDAGHSARLCYSC